MDSTKVEILNRSFDRLVTKLTENSTDSKWDTIIPLLIGAGLTLLTTWLIELWKSKKETKQKTQELISKGRAKTYLIAQIIKDLVMYKVHKQYYFRWSELSSDEKDKEDAYKKHYDKGQEQRATESKLDENVAEYFQLVTEYMVITKRLTELQVHFQNVFQFHHPKSSRFKDLKSTSDLVHALHREEKRLNEEYQKLIDIFETIQTSMNKTY